MQNKYDWQLEPLLNGSTLENLHKEWLKVQAKIINEYPLFLKSFDKFENYLELGEQYSKLSNRLFNYIQNNLNEDLINAKWVGWNQKISNEANILSTKLADYEIKVISNKTLIKSYLKNETVKKYNRAFELTFKTEPHILSKQEEELLSKIDIYTDGFETIFNTLTGSEIKFEDAKDSHNKSILLKTISDVMINIKAKDRILRKTTWISFNKAYNNFENTLTETLYHNYLMLNTHAQIRHFKNYVESTTFSDEINVSLITNLYKEVKAFKPLYQEYRKKTNFFLKKQLGLGKLEPWDKTVDLIKENIKFSIEDAKAIALSSLKPLGDDYLKNIQRCFDENWISWLAKQNKQTGAYSIGGIKGLNRFYISMNFDETYDSIKTLVHELGHSMNSYYVTKNQEIYTSTPIFYAEVSSIVNEMLLSYHLLEKYKENNGFKKMIYEEMIGNFFNTTTRQIIFSNFEFIANKWIIDSKSFTKEKVKDLYKHLIEEYQGVDKDELKKYDKPPYNYALSTILRIGHFYAGNFYVYKYAIGQIVAMIIANKIINNDANAIKKYFDFLSSGSSKSPIDTIKILGIDLYDSGIYSEVVKIIRNLINEYKKLS